MYITETGIADKSDKLRAEWAESYFKAVGPICKSQSCGTCGLWQNQSLGVGFQVGFEGSHVRELVYNGHAGRACGCRWI